MVEKVWSCDDGVGDLKGFNGKKAYILPNFQGKYEELPESDLSERFDDPESHITYYDELGIKKLVGRGALLDRKALWDAQENKHLSEGRFMPMFHTLLGLMSQDETDDEIHLNPLVMSLPVNQMTDDRKKRLVQLCKKTHDIHIELADNTVIKKKIVVKSLVVKSQPFGSYAFKVMDKNGQIIDQLSQTKRTVVFDLGARTLNVLTMDGFSELKGSSFTLPKGMYEAWSTLRDYVQEFKGFNLTIPVVKLAASTEEGIGGNGMLHNGTDITELRDRVYRDHADELLAEFDLRNIGAKDEIDLVLLTGGGSTVLKQHLEKGIKSRFPNAKIQTLGRTATAEGLHKFGTRARNEMVRKQQTESKKTQAELAKNSK